VHGECVDKEGYRRRKRIGGCGSHKVQREKLILSTLLGEEKSVEAKIEEIDFMNSKVLLKEG